MRIEIGVLLLASLLLGVCASALAQNSTTQGLTDQPPRTFDVKTLTFDLWCEETQQYPADRCAKRLPTDIKAFEDYRSAVERYELQYLNQVEQTRAATARANRDPTQAERDRQDAPAPR